MKLKKKLLLTLALAFVFCLSLSPVVAAEFRVAEDNGNISVGPDETVKNLYTAANNVTIDGAIEKSLYAAGRLIIVNGNVENDLNVGGETIMIRGEVGGTVHAGGNNVIIESKINDDLFIGGGNITLTKSASVGGDLFIAGGTIDIHAPVAGNIRISGGEVTINSKVDGQVEIDAGTLRLGHQAELAQNLTYRSSKRAEIADGATILGTIDFDQTQIKKFGKVLAVGTLFGILTFAFLLKLLIYIASGLILIYLFRNIVEPTVKESLTKFWPSLGIGFAALILTPIISIILLVTMIGVWLAGFLMAAYILLILLSLPLASISFGSWLMKMFNKKSSYAINWQTVVVGVIVISIVAIIPVVGWLVAFVFMLISFGALVRLIHKSMISKK